MKKKKRSNYTKEFKEEAVKLVTEQGYSYAEAGRNLGVNSNLLSRWKREIEEDGGDYGNTASLQAELKHLRKENKQLKMEREILKKAAAFFAKEQG
ncbi:MAG: transposase [Desulfobulbaceae bacterium]|nr:transposase [Desulfobulbaceae bacterium]